MVDIKSLLSVIVVPGLALAVAIDQAHAGSGSSEEVAQAERAGAGVSAGHDDRGFHLESADGRYLMRVFGLLQLRGVGTFREDESGSSSTASPDDGTETGVEFRRVELGFAGHVFDPKAGYLLVLAVDGGSKIIAQDVALSYSLTDAWKVAGGRYFAPFLREELIGGGGSLAPALSYMNNELSVGRAEGISVMYDSDLFRAHVFASDGAGGVSNAFSDMSDWALTARSDLKLAGEWGQWGDFSHLEGDSVAAFLGGAIHYQNGESGDDLATPANNVDLLAWTVDGSIECGGFHFFASAAGSHKNRPSLPDLDDFGFVAQSGYMYGRLEPFLRYEVMLFDDANGYSNDTVKLLTGGANFHVNPLLKVGADVMYAFDSVPTDSANAGWLADGSGDGQVVVRLQAQLKF